MGNITTTAMTEPLTYPNTAMIDRENYDGDLWFVKRTTTTSFDVFKSTNNGASWATAGVATYTRANMVETSGVFMDSNGHLHMLYRVYESGTDKIFYTRLAANGTSWSAEQQVVGASAATAGSVYTGMDLVVFKINSTWYIHMAVGTTNGSNGGVTIFSATHDGVSTFTMKNTLVSGYRQWLNGPPGIVHPSIDFVSTGDRKTVGSTPNLWLAWGRSTIYTARLAFNTGPTWISPNTNTPPAVSSLGVAQPSNSALYDPHSDQFVVAWPVGAVVRLGERATDNSTQVQRDSPAHPQGTVKHCAIATSSATSNVRIFAVGTTNSTLYYMDFDRVNNQWGTAGDNTWVQVSAAPIIGARADNYGVRRLNFGNGHYDLVIATGSTPFNLISTSSTAASAPKTPTVTSPSNGSVADVAAGLTLKWTFVDDDPSDFQDAYALRRSIGGGAFAYWNAASSTWGATEVFNLSGSTQVTLPAGWGTDADGTHAYSVKVRDQQGNASPNSANLQLVPSDKDNPTLTGPGASPTTAQVTATWTVATQTAFRIVLQRTSTSEVIYDTGWMTSTGTSFTIPVSLLAVSYTLSLTTRNDETLTSNTVTQVFTPNYTPPSPASLLLTPLPLLGVIRNAITNPDPSGTEALNQKNEVYRRVIGTSGPGVRVAAINPSNPVNLVASYYPSFEYVNSSDNWGTANGSVSTAARDTTQSRSGVASFAQTAVSGAGFAGINFGPLNTFPATPGDQFYLSFWFRATAGVVVKGQVGYRTSANGPTGTPSSGANMTATGAWQQYTMTSTAVPAGAAFAFPSLSQSVSTVTVGDKIYTDDVVFYKVGTGTATPVNYDDFTVASDVAYEYSIVTTAVNGAVTQSAWTS